VEHLELKRGLVWFHGTQCADHWCEGLNDDEWF